MALKSTIYKAELQISDLDRNYYQTHSLTMARHPSETEERLMVRILAFALYADEFLSFSKGLSDVEEPDLWAKDLTGAILLWLETGQPDDKRLLKACGRAQQVVAIAYSSTCAIWWKQIEAKVQRAQNLRVWQLPAESSAQLAAMAARNMQLNVTIQDGQIWFANESESVALHLEALK